MKAAAVLANDFSVRYGVLQFTQLPTCRMLVARWKQRQWIDGASPHCLALVGGGDGEIWSISPLAGEQPKVHQKSLDHENYVIFLIERRL